MPSYMVIKLSFLVAASIAAYKLKQISNNSSKPSNSSINPSDNEEKEEKEFVDSNSCPEKEEEEEVNVERMDGERSSNFEVAAEFGNLLMQTKFGIPENKFDMESNMTEVEYLQNMVNELEERLVTLERELHICYGLNEQEAEMDELMRILKIKASEIEMLNMNIKLLTNDIRRFQKEIKQSVWEKQQLEIAKNKIRELEKKIQINANQTNDRLMMLKDQLAKYEEEGESKVGVVVGKKLKDTDRLEMEAMELKRKNKELQLEKRVLAIKLVVTEARINASSDMKESIVVRRIVSEGNSLRQANEELLKQLERLQKNRFNIVEEVVYQRWVNACLRHEIQSYCTSLRKTSTSDFSYKPNCLPNDGAQQSNLVYAGVDRNQGETDYETVSSRVSSTESKNSNSVSSRNTKFNQTRSLIQKLKTWGKSESRPRVFSSPNQLVSRRLSMSNAHQDGSVSSVKFRKRRFSFSDSTKFSGTSLPKVSELVEIIGDGKNQTEMASEIDQLIKDKVEQSMNKEDSKEAEKGVDSTNACEQKIDDSRLSTNMASQATFERSDVIESRTPVNRNDDAQTQVLDFGSVLVFLIFFLFIYCALHGFGVL